MKVLVCIWYTFSDLFHVRRKCEQKTGSLKNDEKQKKKRPTSYNTPPLVHKLQRSEKQLIFFMYT